MDIHPRAQLDQETARIKFLQNPDNMVRAAALAIVYRDSSVRPFKESYESWNEFGQQVPNTSDTDAIWRGGSSVTMDIVLKKHDFSRNYSSPPTLDGLGSPWQPLTPRRTPFRLLSGSNSKLKTPVPVISEAREDTERERDML
ncbi:hypothetical protein TNCV_324521 [Trichonephila clavipes]|nr:hypothetical protein TNCV_324521 [Trichonephila clavipes]